jgi:hypothetical protein
MPYGQVSEETVQQNDIGTFARRDVVDVYPVRCDFWHVYSM